VLAALVVVAAIGCRSSSPTEGDASERPEPVDASDPDGHVIADASSDAPDAAVVDAMAPDATVVDAMAPDATVVDAMAPDATVVDAMVPDAMVVDAMAPDAAVVDAMVPDAMVADAMVPDAMVPDAGVCVPPPAPEPTLHPTVPTWVVGATVGGAPLGPGSTDAEVNAMLVQRVAEGVSVLEVDSGLSDYLTDAQFATHVAFLGTLATKAHLFGLRAVIYFPSLEVVTPNGVNLAHTMYKDHPDWVQIGLNGKPNVFYGNKEVWVPRNAESAWMSPNTPYRDYFLARVRALAGTGLDGIWADVPVYLETGSAWAGVEPAAAAAFTVATGLTVPTAANFANPVFRAWVRWRHDNLADFIEDIRLAGLSVDPDFMTIIEDFPCDNRDATAVGLDGPYRRSGHNFARVWEIDSVSNTRAMQDATYEDFNSKIAMNKWALAMERGNPTWAFSYGYQPLDAGLTLAAAVATGVVPFEAQTPDMTQSVGSAFRSRWFNFVRQHAEALLSHRRYADVGVWYSSPTRDYSDPGDWGMYITTTNPTDDEDWWADAPADSALPKPHLGGWRAAAHVLTQLGIGYEVVAEPGDPIPQLAELEVVWLPSVTAMSDASATALKDFVFAGGTVIATGGMPATLDETGATRPASALAELFVPGMVTRFYGNGVAIYRPDLRGADMYELAGGDATTARAQTAAMEQLLRAHVPDVVRFTGGPGIHVELARPSATRHYLYVVNYTGLAVPVVQHVINLPLTYRPPTGYAITAATAFTPDLAGQAGSLVVTPTVDGAAAITIGIDQFAMIALDLAPVGPVCPR